MFHTVFQRDKRHPGQMRHPGPMHHPLHSSVANYWTETFQKREMKHDFSDDLFLNNIHLIPDPLKKNLADTLFNTDVPRNTERVHQKSEKMALNDQKVPLENMSENPQKHAGTTFSGIGSFFSGVMNVLTSVMFRSRSPNYYDCFDVDGHQGSYNWQSARTDVQDKNGKAYDRDDFDAPSNPNVSSDMNIDSRAAVTSCESKLNQVLHLLTPRQTSSPVWVRKRPKKAFVEPGSVCESFEDAFSPEDFSSLPDESFVEYYSPVQHHCEDLFETAALRTQTNTAPGKQNTDCVEDVSNKSELDFNAGVLGNNEIQPEKDKTQCDTTDKVQSEEATLILNKEEGTKATTELETKPETGSTKEQLVSSCEDKLSKLKALLLEKRSKCRTKQIVEARTTPPKNIPPEKKPADKHYKNPHRRSNKRDKSKLKCRIEDDLVFANEISVGTPPSADNSPAQHNVNFGDYFDEISGRFRTVSTGSDDSFQIVFNECVNTGRVRRSSDCDSEDSFIVFEDSPDCYVSNDVFDTDSESEVSDSGCGITCKLAHSLTRTISNLADDSLYAESEDEVDFGVKCDVKERTGLELEDTSLVQEKTFLDCGASSLVKEKSGLLLDAKKKLLRKSQPAKRVQFSSAPPKVHVMRVWAFAARQARAGHWERCALDRERFKRRIADVDMAVSWVLKPQHRSRVMFQRFMPWWNQLKRKELAQKKEREALDKQKEEERQKLLAENDSKVEEPVLETEEESATNKVDVTHATGVGENQKDTAKTMEDHDTKRDIELTQDNFDVNTGKVIYMEKETLETQKSNVKNTLPVINKQCLETNNNKTQIESDKQIVSDLIISDSALAKKIQELEVDDKNNYDIVS